MEPSPKSPGICWERSLCLPFLGRQERGGWRGSPGLFQASSSSPPMLSTGKRHGQETPGFCRAPEAWCRRRGSATGNTSVQRDVCAEHLHVWDLSKHCRSRVSKSCSQKDLSRGCSSLRGTLTRGSPGAGAPLPTDHLGAMGAGPRCHRHGAMGEPGRALQRVLPSPARCEHTHTCTRTHAHARARTGLCRAGAGACGRPPPAPGTVAPPALSNVSGGELIANTHGRALRVAAGGPGPA